MLHSYVGMTDVTSTATYSDNTVIQHSGCLVTFARPHKIRMEGKTAPVYPWDADSGAPFTIISNGDRTWRSWALDNDGAFRMMVSVEEAIDEMAGVTRGASQTIPRILLELPEAHLSAAGSGKPFLESFADRAEFAACEELEGQACDCVVSEQPFGTWTLWIDAETLLLRRLETRKDNAEIRKFTASRKSRIIESVAREAYEVRPVDVPMDDAVFRPLGWVSASSR